MLAILIPSAISAGLLQPSQFLQGGNYEVCEVVDIDLQPVLAVVGPF
jgi:hypothetical protein